MQPIGANAPIDEFVPDPKVRKEFSVTPMTMWRWDHDPVKVELGWPPPIKIGDRNYRSRKLLEQFKANLLRLAIESRDGRTA
jgi:hypothetical protein